MGLLTLALILDLLIGDPDWMWRRVQHPVVWIGRFIDWADELRNSIQYRKYLDSDSSPSNSKVDFRAGVLLVIVLFVLAIMADNVVSFFGVFGWFAELIIVAVLIAQKSLYDHVKKVADGLESDGLSGGRVAVSMIVGRDVSELDESGVSKAAIESLAENFSDGVVAPAFWYLVAGLPGILFYKAINTADSMIGHRNERYEHFGKASAKVDDWLNWPAARITSFLITMAILLGEGWQKAKHVWNITTRDAGSHRSPNAGWPESSFAAALSLALGGPRRYGDDEVAADYLYEEGRKEASRTDIFSALRLFLRSCFCLVSLCSFIWLFGFR